MYWRPSYRGAVQRQLVISTNSNFVSSGLHADDQSTQNMGELHFSAKTIITVCKIVKLGKLKLSLPNLHLLHIEDHSLYSLNYITPDKHTFPSYFLGLWRAYRIKAQTHELQSQCEGAGGKRAAGRGSPPYSSPGLCQISNCITMAWCKQKRYFLSWITWQGMRDLTCRWGEDKRVKPLSTHNSRFVSNGPKLEMLLETHTSKELL